MMRPGVDWDERRAELAEAVWRVIAKRGIESVSIRAVADETPWSRGVIQTYFRNKDDLLIAAFDQVAQRSEQIIARVVDDKSGLAALRAVLLTYARPDDEQHVVFSVLEAFGVRSTSQPDLAIRYREVHAAWRLRTVAFFRELAEAGEIRSDVSPEAAAGHYYAFSMGLSFQAYVDPETMSDGRAEAAIDAYIQSMQAPVAAD